MRKKLAEDIVSLNDNLHSEFAIQELELRLETDPFLFMDFFQSELFYLETDCTAPGAYVTCDDGGTLI
ncbi:MAG: hypothetical protein LBG80_09110, partial [Bacteroidales bacterium]|nr:hypothetical protein [Bacteroidales bacterium]